MEAGRLMPDMIVSIAWMKKRTGKAKNGNKRAQLKVWEAHLGFKQWDPMR